MCRAYIKVFDTIGEIFIILKIKISLIIRIKCYYEIIYFEILKLFGNSPNILMINKLLIIKFIYHFICLTISIYV